MEFKPYKDNEYLENSYYKIPQELFESSLYKDKLNRLLFNDRNILRI